MNLEVQRASLILKNQKIAVGVSFLFFFLFLYFCNKSETGAKKSDMSGRNYGYSG